MNYKVFKRLRSNKLIKNMLIYGLTNALYSGLPFLLLPFLVALLEPEDYGMVDLFRSITMILVPVLGFSAVQSIGRFYFDLEEEQFKKLVSSIQLFQLITAFIATVIVFLIGHWIGEVYRTLIILCIVYFLFNQFIESLLVIFRVTDKSKNYMAIRILNIVLELIVLYILYRVINNLDWTFRVYPMVVSSVLVGIICWFCFRRLGYKVEFSMKLLRQALVYSSPLIVHMLSGYVLNIGDRFFIKYYLDEEALGNYAVAYQVGMTVNFFYTSFNLAWTPTYYKWMKEKRYSTIKKVKKIVYLSLLLLGFFNLILWLVFNPFLKENTNYQISTHIVIIVLVGNVILSLYKFESNFFLFNKNTKKLSVFTFISATIAILLNILLIPLLGILGAAYASLFSFILIYILVILNRKNEKKY